MRKTTNRQKPGKPDSVYQPLLENIVEPPLIEPDENSPKTITENIPGIADFSIQRPARKWEDRLPENGRTGRRKSSSIDLLHDFTAERPARKWDDQNAGDEFTIQYDDDGMLQLPSWWQEDAPLVETDTTEAEEKTSEAETAALVNSVSPGWFLTKLNEEMFARNPDRRAAAAAKPMLSRFGQPEEIGYMMLFLLSGASLYITGRDFPVDGGALAHGF